MKGLEGDPLTKIEKKTEETIFIIQLDQSSANPKAFKMPAENCQFNLS